MRHGGNAARLGLAFALLATPALAAVEDADVARARARLDEARQAAVEVTRQIEEARARGFRLEAEIEELANERASTQSALRKAVAEVEELAVRLYISAASGETLQIALVPRSADLAAGLQYLKVATGEGEDALDRLAAVGGELDRQRDALEAAVAEQAAVSRELEDLAAAVQSRLAAAMEGYEALAAAREEGRRRQAAAAAAAAAAATTTTTSQATTTAPPTGEPAEATAATTAGTTTSTTVATTTTTVPPSTSSTTAPTTTTAAPEPESRGGVCPVAGPVSFVDTWGDPRSGGRIHQGVDMIAARGTPVVAVYPGTVIRMSQSTLGGITLWLRVASGDELYYAHLDGYASGVVSGGGVGEGTVIAFVGSTGNAPDFLPHLHFELHPGGGAAVNPYPMVRSLCG